MQGGYTYVLQQQGFAYRARGAVYVRAWYSFDRALSFSVLSSISPCVRRSLFKAIRHQ